MFGYETIDLNPQVAGKIGLTGTCTKHVFGKCQCVCGFETASAPYRADPEKGWSIGLGEWKLIGPRLLALISFCKIKLHHSIGKTRALLQYFGISLSEGTICAALKEAGQAASDLEPEILEALRASEVVHVDESPWKENKKARWIWVGVGKQVVYFTIGARTTEMVLGILGNFTSWLMSDGYVAYRGFKKRIRCWAHLTRKARGLEESSNPEHAVFGKMALGYLESLQGSVYKMREMDGAARKGELKKAEHQSDLFCIEMLRHRDAPQEPVAAFAGEILNDPTAIFAVLSHPDLPLTNNAAERALRPAVIMRKISHGSKTHEGARSLAHLASAYETVQLRIGNALSYLAELFRIRRRGSRSPPLPQAS